MSDNNIQPGNPELDILADSTVPPTGRGIRRSGLLRAVLYTPVVLMLSGLAASATFPNWPAMPRR